MTAQASGSLLFELGTEELPSGPLTAMATALRDGIADGLTRHGLGFTDALWYATPRRLAVLVTELALEAPQTQQEILGPPAAAAKDADGNWSKAAIGFARKQELDPEDLQIIDSDKGPRLGLTRVQPGAIAREVAPEVIAAAVAAIPVAKRMRWGRERHEFLRPVQWLTALLDDEVIPVQLFGITAERQTRGHRFHHPQPIALKTALDYPSALEGAQVVASFDQRRAMIVDQVNTLAADADATAVISDDLLDEVTGLVEWPQALIGSFDPDFLKIPAQALISSMKEHQKYFHLVDADGQLLPRFITVANLVSDDPSVVVQGNEKVIRPRLSDAAFFFETDKKQSLESRAGALDGVVFQQKLGTLRDKARRMERLGQWLAGPLGADATVVQRIALLAKCDLVSDMVLEFPDLQGIAGAHYALNDGEPDAVASGIEQHYWPKFAGDSLPASPEAAAVALADRLDTMVGIFGIGQSPTGSRDPFALRRASVAIIRILIDLDSDLDLATLAEEAVAGYPDGLLESGTADRVAEYAIERLRAWYEDQGVGIEVLRAVTATGIMAPAEIDRRVRALMSFADSDAARALAAANKRVANILDKADTAIEGAPSPDLFVEPEESRLFEALKQAEQAVSPLMESRDYGAALAALASLRDPVDAFFDTVMVNTEEPELRLNRYRILATLRGLFLGIADISHLKATG